MNTNQIRFLLKGLKGFLGVFASDEIPRIVPHKIPQCFVANLDPSWKPGSHWVAFCIRKSKNIKVLEYFDSYGLFPPLELNKKEWKVIYNKTRFQKLRSTVCGHYCVFFVRQRLTGTSFQSIIKTLKRQPDPDNFVKKRARRKLPGVGQCCQPCSCPVVEILWNLTKEA